MKITWRSFVQAREFVHKLKLKKRDGPNGWKEYCKSGNKPDDIPSTPRSAYKKIKNFKLSKFIH